MTAEHNVTTRRHLLGSLTACALLGTLTSAQAQAWPRRPIKILVPFAAGGNADFMARLIADRLGQTLGEPFIVEARPGAAGALAAEAVARAAPDGNTLFMGSPSQISILPLVTKTPYDPVRDLAPISVIGTNPKVWAISGTLPTPTFAEFVDYVRQRPDQLAYADAGAGSMPHLSTALVLNRARLRMIRVSYKGSGVSTTDLVAGRISVSFTNLATVMPHLADGSIKVLAVASERRSPQIPAVPTFAEAGFPGLVMFTWQGLMAPAGTPRTIIDRIAEQVARAVKDPAIAQRLAAGGIDPVGNTPDEFAALIAADIALWKDAIQIAGPPAKD